MGGTTDRYDRDATGRVIAVRQGGTTVARYTYSGSSDSPVAVLDASSAVIDRLISLPGGATVRKRAGADLWSYPNIHGDTVATANGSGVKQGTTRTYDPYGQALAGTPDTYTGPLDPGWLGGPQRLTDTANNIIQMGARPYVPSLGRFLAVDPVFGGSCNNYDYTCADPVDGRDLDGSMFFDSAGIVNATRGYKPGSNTEVVPTMVDKFGNDVPLREGGSNWGAKYMKKSHPEDFDVDLMQRALLYGIATPNGLTRMYFDLLENDCDPGGPRPWLFGGSPGDIWQRRFRVIVEYADVDNVGKRGITNAYWSDWRPLRFGT